MICGAPGSGTSLVTKMLRTLGMFAGSDAGSLSDRKFHESIAFRNANNQILSATIEFPHAPKSANQFLDHVTILEESLAKWVALINLAELKKDYLGETTDYRCLGWKDPRNSANVLLWKTIFPDLRIITIRKKWRWLERKKAGTPAGIWYRTQSNKKIRELYINPPHADGLDRFQLDFDKLFTGPKHLQSLLDWVGLPQNSYFDYAEFIQRVTETGGGKGHSGN